MLLTHNLVLLIVVSRGRFLKYFLFKHDPGYPHREGASSIPASPSTSR
jgi:hypothetical protein